MEKKDHPVGGKKNFNDQNRLRGRGDLIEEKKKRGRVESSRGTRQRGGNTN